MQMNISAFILLRKIELIKIKEIEIGKSNRWTLSMFKTKTGL